MPRVSELLERESETVDLEGGHFERLLRRRDRKRRNQRIGAGALAIILALVSFAALARALNTDGGPAVKPAPPNFTGMVITYSGADPRTAGELVAQDPDTGEVLPLASVDPPIGHDYSLISSAAWSADTRWIAFEAFHCGPVGSDAAGTGGLWVTNGLDEPRQLTRPCLEDPDVDHIAEIWAWSPAGDQLVVVRVSADGDSLVLIDPATGARTDLGHTLGRVTALTWSPDGTRIAYGTRQGSIYSVDAGGGEHSLLTDSIDDFVAGGIFGSGFGITWSPDGGHIAVQAEHFEDNDPHDTLYLMNADGSDLRQLAGDLEAQGIYFGPNLSWSPDGTRIAYATNAGGRDDQQQQIWITSADGSNPTLLFEAGSSPSAEFGSAGSPVWSPDGERVAFGSARNDGKRSITLVANADGTGHVREIDEFRYQSWRGGWYFCGCYG